MHIYVLNCHFDLYKNHFVTLSVDLFKSTKLELYVSDIPDIKFEKLNFRTKGLWWDVSLIYPWRDNGTHLSTNDTP